MYPDTHSQYDEEQAILAYFKAKYKLDDFAHFTERMRFLDIGAWSPTTFSNTRALFLRGFDGVLIEPSPGPMLGLLKEYGNEPRVSLVQAAVAVDPAPIRMWISDDGLSTNDPASYEKWKATGGFLGQATVLTITWEQINLWYGGFQFVNIDAEGCSVDLFRAMLKSGALPECVCVEHDGRLIELAALATTAGYRMTYANGTNAVFTR